MKVSLCLIAVFVYTVAGKALDSPVLTAEALTTPELHHVSYYLYTQLNPNSPEIITDGNFGQLRASSHFNPSRRNLFIIHGWVDSAEADVNKLVRAAALKHHDLNVFCVDWSELAALGYGDAKAAVVGVGGFVGEFINDLMDEFGLSGVYFMLVGHSLGAHIAGNAGAATKVPIDHIIGLDPAAPSFTVENTAERLDPTDADYVQIIHTSTNLLGFKSSIGHADFYPNGGKIQTGCGLDLLGACSHARAFQFLAECIDGGNFIATQCASYSDYEKGNCDGNRKVRMAEIRVDKTVVGDYYLKTNPEPPFALG